MSLNLILPDSDVNLKVMYAYDNLNRLIGEYGYNTEVNPATSVYERLFGYDKAGNRNLMIEHDRDIQYTGWDLDYNDLNQLIYKYTNDGGYGVGGENDKRIAYQYDDNGNLTESHKEVHLSGSWSSTLEWDYTWDVRNQMTSASKYVGGSYAGKAEYKYSHANRGQRTERILYDSSNAITSWKRYVNDGLLIYRVEERYDSNGDGIASNDPWRVTENRSYRPGLISNLVFKEVFNYPQEDSTSGVFSKVYYYGYDAVGNVIFVSEDYCGGTRLAYTFMQDAFGNQISTGVFDGDSWTDAAGEGVYEHQTGKEYDTFTELYYFHHRWFDPTVGRFVSRSLISPIVESQYVFCGNTPLNLVDPDGLLPIPPGGLDLAKLAICMKKCENDPHFFLCVGRCYTDDPNPFDPPQNRGGSPAPPVGPPPYRGPGPGVQGPGQGYPPAPPSHKKCVAGPPPSRWPNLDRPLWPGGVPTCPRCEIQIPSLPPLPPPPPWWPLALLPLVPMFIFI